MSDTINITLGVALLMFCWIAPLALGVDFRREMKLAWRTLKIFLHVATCWIFQHPMDRPLIVRRTNERTVQLYCPRCGAWLMTHVDLNWKP